MADHKEKKGKTLAEANEEKEEEKTWLEAMTECWEDTKVFCYHKGQDDQDLYCNLGCEEWGWLLLFFFCLYAFNTAFFSLLLHLEVDFGIGVLYGFLAVFLVSVSAIAIVLYVGHKEHLVREETKRETRRKIEGEDKLLEEKV